MCEQTQKKHDKVIEQIIYILFKLKINYIFYQCILTNKL